MEASAEAEQEIDLCDEWHDKLKRDSFAKSSLVKVKSVAGSTYFTKGKLVEIGEYIKDSRPDVVFMDTLLTPLQQNKLEKYWNDIIMNKGERLKKYMIKAYSKDVGEPTDLDTTTASGSDTEGIKHEPRPIKVIDRFAIILQIFAQRAKSKEAKIQLELAWLNHIKHRLTRDSEGSFTTLTKFFSGETPVYLCE